MKTFETPIAEINMFAVEDVLTTSTSGETEFDESSQYQSFNWGHCTDMACDWDPTDDVCV